jgi:hypothetical protein
MLDWESCTFDATRVEISREIIFLVGFSGYSTMLNWQGLLAFCRNLLHVFGNEDKMSAFSTVLTWCCTQKAVQGPSTFFTTEHQP